LCASWTKRSRCSSTRTTRIRASTAGRTSRSARDRDLARAPWLTVRDSELAIIAKPFIRNEDDSKFRCLVEGCTKLFKALNFAEKHIMNKHGELVESRLHAVRRERPSAIRPSP
jgi:hypothetical protein